MRMGALSVRIIRKMRRPESVGCGKSRRSTTWDTPTGKLISPVIEQLAERVSDNIEGGALLGRTVDALSS